MSTTTTAFGLFAGAQDAYHEWSPRPAPDSARPVLPATHTGKFAQTATDVPAAADPRGPGGAAGRPAPEPLRPVRHPRAAPNDERPAEPVKPRVARLRECGG